MEKQGVASFWIGNGDTSETFNRITDYTISEGGLGDFVPSAFCLALRIDRYEPDYFGGHLFPKQLTKDSLLFHGSQVGQLLERWSDVPPSNCSIALYDYEYDGRIAEFEVENFRFKFLGAFPYS